MNADKAKFKFEKLAHYFPAYEREFRDLNPGCVLEIGVQGGGSLHHWAAQFPQAKVFGIDIDASCKGAEMNGVKVFIGDATSKRFLEEALLAMPRPDLIIDDGGHWPWMQRKTFEVLWPALRPGGVYAVEDLDTSFRKRFGGWFGGFFRYLNRLAQRQTREGSDVERMSQYRSIVFLHKSYPDGAMGDKVELAQRGEVDCRRGRGIKGSTALAMARFRLNHRDNPRIARINAN